MAGIIENNFQIKVTGEQNLNKILTSLEKIQGMTEINLNVSGGTTGGSKSTKDYTKEIYDLLVAQEKLKRELEETRKEKEKSAKVEKNWQDASNKTKKSLEEQTKALQEQYSQTEKSTKNIDKLAAAHQALQLHMQMVANIKDAINELRKLDETMYNLGAITERTTGEIENMKYMFLDLATTIPISAIEMAKSVDLIVRTGLSYKDAMMVMEASAKLAIASGEKLSYISNIMSRSLVAFRLEGIDATKAINSFFSAVLQSPLNMKGIQDSLKNAASSFATLIDFTEKSGAELKKYKTDLLDLSVAMTASLSKLGLNSSTSGITIRNLINRLLTGEKRAKQLFDSLNLEMDGTIITFEKFSRIASEDVFQALDLLSRNFDKLAKNRDVLKAMFTQRQWARIAPLLDEINGNTQAWVDTLTTGKSAIKGYTTQLESFDNKMKIFEQNITNAKKVLYETVKVMGNDFLPVANNVLKFMGDLESSTGKTVVQTLALTAAVTTLSIALGAMASTGAAAFMLTLVSNPVILGVAALTAGVGAIYFHLKNITHEREKEIDAIRKANQELNNMQNYVNSIKNEISTINKQIRTEDETLKFINDKWKKQIDYIEQIKSQSKDLQDIDENILKLLELYNKELDTSTSKDPSEFFKLDRTLSDTNKLIDLNERLGELRSEQKKDLDALPESIRKIYNETSNIGEKEVRDYLKSKNKFFDIPRDNISERELVSLVLQIRRQSELIRDLDNERLSIETKIEEKNKKIAENKLKEQDYIDGINESLIDADKNIKKLIMPDLFKSNFESYEQFKEIMKEFLPKNIFGTDIAPEFDKLVGSFGKLVKESDKLKIVTSETFYKYMIPMDTYLNKINLLKKDSVKLEEEIAKQSKILPFLKGKEKEEVEKLIKELEIKLKSEKEATTAMSKTVEYYKHLIVNSKEFNKEKEYTIKQYKSLEEKIKDQIDKNELLNKSEIERLKLREIQLENNKKEIGELDNINNNITEKKSLLEKIKQLGVEEGDDITFKKEEDKIRYKNTKQALEDEEKKKLDLLKVEEDLKENKSKQVKYYTDIKKEVEKYQEKLIDIVNDETKLSEIRSIIGKSQYKTEEDINKAINNRITELENIKNSQEKLDDDKIKKLEEEIDYFKTMLKWIDKVNKEDIKSLEVASKQIEKNNQDINKFFENNLSYLELKSKYQKTDNDYWINQIKNIKEEAKYQAIITELAGYKKKIEEGTLTTSEAERLKTLTEELKVYESRISQSEKDLENQKKYNNQTDQINNLINQRNRLSMTSLEIMQEELKDLNSKLLIVDEGVEKERILTDIENKRLSISKQRNKEMIANLNSVSNLINLFTKFDTSKLFSGFGELFKIDDQGLNYIQQFQKNVGSGDLLGTLGTVGEVAGIGVGIAEAIKPLIDSLSIFSKKRLSSDEKIEKAVNKFAEQVEKLSLQSVSIKFEDVKFQQDFSNMLKGLDLDLPKFFEGNITQTAEETTSIINKQYYVARNRIKDLLGITSEDLSQAIKSAFSAENITEFADNFKNILKTKANEAILEGIVQNLTFKNMFDDLTNEVVNLVSKYATDTSMEFGFDKSELDTVESKIEAITEKGKQVYEILKEVTIDIDDNSAYTKIDALEEELKNVLVKGGLEGKKALQDYFDSFANEIKNSLADIFVNIEYGNFLNNMKEGFKEVYSDIERLKEYGLDMQEIYGMFSVYIERGDYDQLLTSLKDMANLKTDFDSYFVKMMQPIKEKLISEEFGLTNDEVDILFNNLLNINAEIYKIPDSLDELQAKFKNINVTELELARIKQDNLKQDEADYKEKLKIHGITKGIEELENNQIGARKKLTEFVEKYGKITEDGLIIETDKLDLYTELTNEVEKNDKLLIEGYEIGIATKENLEKILELQKESEVELHSQSLWLKEGKSSLDTTINTLNELNNRWKEISGEISSSDAQLKNNWSSLRNIQSELKGVVKDSTLFSDIFSSMNFSELNIDDLTKYIEDSRLSLDKMLFGLQEGTDYIIDSEKNTLSLLDDKNEKAKEILEIYNEEKEKLLKIEEILPNLISTYLDRKQLQKEINEQLKQTELLTSKISEQQSIFNGLYDQYLTKLAFNNKYLDKTYDYETEIINVIASILELDKLISIEQRSQLDFAKQYVDSGHDAYKILDNMPDLYKSIEGNLVNINYAVSEQKDIYNSIGKAISDNAISELKSKLINAIYAGEILEIEEKINEIKNMQLTKEQHIQKVNEERLEAEVAFMEYVEKAKAVSADPFDPKKITDMQKAYTNFIKETKDVDKIEVYDEEKTKKDFENAIKDVKQMIQDLSKSISENEWLKIIDEKFGSQVFETIKENIETNLVSVFDRLSEAQNSSKEALELWFENAQKVTTITIGDEEIKNIEAYKENIQNINSLFDNQYKLQDGINKNSKELFELWKKNEIKAQLQDILQFLPEMFQNINSELTNLIGKGSQDFISSMGQNLFDSLKNTFIKSGDFKSLFIDVSDVMSKYTSLSPDDLLKHLPEMKKELGDIYNTSNLDKYKVLLEAINEMFKEQLTLKKDIESIDSEINEELEKRITLSYQINNNIKENLMEAKSLGEILTLINEKRDKESDYLKLSTGYAVEMVRRGSSLSDVMQLLRGTTQSIVSNLSGMNTKLMESEDIYESLGENINSGLLQEIKNKYISLKYSNEILALNTMIASLEEVMNASSQEELDLSYKNLQSSYTMLELLKGELALQDIDNELLKQKMTIINEAQSSFESFVSKFSNIISSDKFYAGLNWFEVAKKESSTTATQIQEDFKSIFDFLSEQSSKVTETMEMWFKGGKQIITTNDTENMVDFSSTLEDINNELSKLDKIQQSINEDSELFFELWTSGKIQASIEQVVEYFSQIGKEAYNAISSSLFSEFTNFGSSMTDIIISQLNKNFLESAAFKNMLSRSSDIINSFLTLDVTDMTGNIDDLVVVLEDVYNSPEAEKYRAVIEAIMEAWKKAQEAIDGYTSSVFEFNKTGIKDAMFKLEIFGLGEEETLKKQIEYANEGLSEFEGSIFQNKIAVVELYEELKNIPKTLNEAGEYEFTNEEDKKRYDSLVEKAKEAEDVLISQLNKTEELRQLEKSLNDYYEERRRLLEDINLERSLLYAGELEQVRVKKEILDDQLRFTEDELERADLYLQILQLEKQEKDLLKERKDYQEDVKDSLSDQKHELLDIIKQYKTPLDQNIFSSGIDELDDLYAKLEMTNQHMLEESKKNSESIINNFLNIEELSDSQLNDLESQAEKWSELNEKEKEYWGNLIEIKNTFKELNDAVKNTLEGLNDQFSTADDLEKKIALIGKTEDEIRELRKKEIEARLDEITITRNQLDLTQEQLETFREINYSNYENLETFGELSEEQKENLKLYIEKLNLQLEYNNLLDEELNKTNELKDGLINAFKQSLSAENFSSGVDILSDYFSTTIVEDMKEKLIDDKFKNSLENTYNQLYANLQSGFNVGVIQQSAAAIQRIQLQAEAERNKINVLKDLITYTSDIDLSATQKEIQYTTGSTANVTNNFNISNTIGGLIMKDPTQMQSLADALVEYQLVAFEEIGIKLSRK